MPNKKTRSLGSTAQALYDQAAHVFGSPQETHIPASVIERPPRVARLPKSEKKSNTINNDLSVKFPADVIASVPRKTRKKKVVSPSPSANQETTINIPSETAAQKATRESLARQAVAYENSLAQSMASVPPISSTVVGSSSALTLYEPPVASASNDSVPSELVPHMADNVNISSVLNALSMSKKTRSKFKQSGKKGGNLRGVYNSAGMAAQIAMSPPPM